MNKEPQWRLIVIQGFLGILELQFLLVARCNQSDNGICCSYYDSVPLLIITGQVSTGMTGKTRVRQIGFQETPITKIVKITKYSTTMKSRRY